jgi:hypothetical protein
MSMSVSELPTFHTRLFFSFNINASLIFNFKEPGMFLSFSAGRKCYTNLLNTVKYAKKKLSSHPMKKVVLMSLS